MIPRETIEQIYSTAKIEEVIGDYVSLRRRGANLWGNCPFHDEKTPSFSVSPSKGIYKCFGCGKAGNVANFVMEAEKCSYADALRQIAKRYHIQIKEKEQTDEERQQQSERDSLFVLNDWARQWFEDQLWNTEEGQAIGLKYFYERGLQEDTIRKFKLGYSPQKNALYYAAKAAGYQEEFLQKTGLCGVSQFEDKEQDSKRDRWYDRFRDRVIFPIFTISGKTVAFAGRILKKKEHTGKYVNSPESAIYSKQNELYGLFQARNAIAKQQMCYLVEGQMDVISMHQSGVENVVSSGGTALTHRQVLLLHRLTENVTILYDGDAAGIHAALRGIDMLLEEGLNIKVVLLPDGEDPDSFSRKLNAVDFQEYLKANSQDFIRFKTNLLLKDASSDPIKKSDVIKNIVQSIAVIPDVITRQVYVKDCSALLQIREETLLKETQKIRKERYSKKQGDGNSATTTEAETQEPTIPAVEQNEVLRGEENTIQPQTNTKLDLNIRNLLQVLIKYGDLPLFTMPDNSIWSVGQYIIAELDNDNIRFTQNSWQHIIDIYRPHLNDSNFKAEQFYKFNPDSEVASLAVELISDKYELSKIYSRQSISENVQSEAKMPSDKDRLPELVPQLIYELKDTILEEQINYLLAALKHASENHLDEEESSLLIQITQLQQIRKQINNSPYLGKRVII